jgi:hypothetical protein
MKLVELIMLLQTYAARFGDSEVFVGDEGILGVVENVTVSPDVDDEGPALVIWID